MKHVCVTDRDGCPECEIPQMARNTLFDGKIMSAQDFVDEQAYFMGKDRRHNQLLHGWGTVCGLKVLEHPNPDCRPQYVIVTAGAAIDCCGREILVRHNAMFDFRAAFLEAWTHKNGKNVPPDDKPHRLELAIRYAECPTDPVPAVFEGCGSGEAACLPSKILEGFSFAALLDRPPQDLPVEVRQLDWECTNNIDHAKRLALHEGSKRLYVLTGESPAMLVALDTENKSIQASVSFVDHAGVDVAVSADGAHLFCVLHPDAGGDAVLRVLDTANLAAVPPPDIKITDAAAGEVRLLALADGRLLAANPENDEVLVWKADIVTAAPSAPASIAVADKPVALAIGPLGNFVYVAAGDAAKIIAVKLADMTTVALDVGTGGTARLSAIAVSQRDNSDLLAVADRAASTVHLFKALPEAAAAADRVVPVGAAMAGLVAKPVALAFSLGGKWLYLLSEAADGKGAAQIISVDRRAANQSPWISAAEPAGLSPQQVVADASGRHLYLAFDGSPAAADPRIPGGVAIFEICGDSCGDILLKSLEGCPACEDGDEIVLATIVDYRFNDPLTTARIDNVTGRRLLPSTSVLTEAIRCLLDCECGGGGGTEGPQGPKGDKGDPGEDGQDGADGAPGRDGADGLPGRDGQDGRDGKDGEGLRDDYPRIVGINWPHGGYIAEDGNILDRQGIVIAFDPERPILAETLNLQTVQLLFQHMPEGHEVGRRRIFTRCYCQVVGRASGLKIEARCGEEFDVPEEDIPLVPGNIVTGVRFRACDADGEFIGGPIPLPQGRYRVVLEGNFILGEKMIEVADPGNPGEKRKVHPALDANHFGFGLTDPDPERRRCPTGDRVEGGRFLSWFTINRDGRPPEEDQ
ncbi:conserved hypothetical protein [Mesorhizobium prunaredense]|uniref:Collagen triple helix repeat protein n=1 Tax=Mesorhizobium prunaredense TaxID=1631249 RepID=A0A1R3VFL8_9HYPH|nr:hypothetical protein [Mesorhizobium prunaredense]SIT58625.1 conserved hypothetical protein [Mesorhizobium prunaredense]